MPGGWPGYTPRRCFPTSRARKWKRTRPFRERRLASYYLRGERGDHTLQATALVHEPICALSIKELFSGETATRLWGLRRN